MSYQRLSPPTEKGFSIWFGGDSMWRGGFAPWDERLDFEQIFRRRTCGGWRRCQKTRQHGPAHAIRPPNGAWGGRLAGKPASFDKFRMGNFCYCHTNIWGSRTFPILGNCVDCCWQPPFPHPELVEGRSNMVQPIRYVRRTAHRKEAWPESLRRSTSSGWGILLLPHECQSARKTGSDALSLHALFVMRR
jgi:hypothetical protein